MTDTLTTTAIPFDLTADELDLIADMAKDLAASSPRENAYQQIWYTIADKCQALAKALGSQLPEFEIARKEQTQ